MSTFTPPSVNEVPPTLPQGDPEQSAGALRLMRFYRARPAGVNVYLYRIGTLSATAHGRITEDDPIALYGTDGVMTTNGWEDIEVVFWGGHGPTDLISDWATVLTGAGYTVDP